MKNPLFREKSVCVVGCGGLGNNIVAHLAGAGIGKLILYDFDNVEISNLDRQFLFSVKNIGKSKCSLMKDFINSYDPDIRVIAAEKKIESETDLSEAADSDLVILAADNNNVRKIVQQFCSERSVPLVNGGVGFRYGTAYLYVPEKTPCLDCAGLLAAESRSTSTVSSSVGVIGSLCAEIALCYLTGDYTEHGTLYVYDNLCIDKLKIQPNSDCNLCHNLRR